MAGIPRSRTILTPQSMVLVNLAVSEDTAPRESDGRITVLMAIANIPRGNSRILSE